MYILSERGCARNNSTFMFDEEKEDFILNRIKREGHGREIERIKESYMNTGR